MFKAAKEGPAKVITANDLRDGLVVFLDQEGGWTVHIAEARVVEDGPDLDSAWPSPRRRATRKWFWRPTRSMWT